MPDEAPRTDGQQDDRPDQRTGEDTRRRGWFWHWNSIVTQYAPLIGLKGVGLLNSYTVWTDRREDSPHRGFAFPSQQAESNFYGEDRAELITINKILVALDLIEVRKEMVLHVDDRGRRWRVPHNLYRVKDNPSGFNLTVEDVLRVAELAAKTPAVYRYVRRIFSSGFTPIDSKNPWHEILPAVRQTEVWQKLAARAAREDARASARSKAGHRKRKDKNGETRHDDSAAAEASTDEVAQAQDPQTTVEPANIDQMTDVRTLNNGSDGDVDETNRGLARIPPTSDGPSNEGGSGVVQPTNTTYNQEIVNTTRTTTGEFSTIDEHEDHQPPAGEIGSGPVLQGSAATLVAFQAANDRPATGLERELLGELERDFADAAGRAGHSPSEWVVQAIREAVNSGSRFVAPKRVREILSRWASAASGELRSGRSAKAVGSSGRGSRQQSAADQVGTAWRAILSELQSSQDWAEIGDPLIGSVLLGEEDGRIRIGLAENDVPESVQRRIRHAVEPRFSSHLGRGILLDVEPAAQEVISSADEPFGEEDTAGNVDSSVHLPGTTTPSAAPAPSRFTVVDGLTNHQVWSAAQDDLRNRISSANFETWIRPTSLIGREEDGSLVLGVPNRFAQQRVESKLLDDIEVVLRRIIGEPVTVRVAVSQQWLRERGVGQDSG